MVKGMDRDKAPSPDGFSIAFFQDCWVVIKEDIMAVFLYFYARGKFEKILNATFIPLFLRCLGLPSLRSFILLVL